MRRFYALLIPIITLLNIYILESQEIVFNEYRSAYLENPASIELLVVENYLDMRGFYLRDSYNDKWAVGVKFRYNDLWKNIKSGTCIVVDLDGNSYPTYDEMQNGVIRVNINDAEYFEFLDTNLKADINAKGKFEIESKSDLFQILNSGKNPIHTASHGSEISNLYNSTPQPKLRLNSSLPIHCSFNVYPGKNIDGYYSTFTANVVQSEHVSIGRANIVNGATSYNADFWYDLRKPSYNSYNCKIIEKDGTKFLTWNKISINEQHEDKYGYLIMYGKESDVSNYTYVGPTNGTVYKENDKINSWVIYANLNDANMSQYKIRNDLAPDSYIFKVVPYAFISKHTLDPNSGLGPSYANSEHNIAKVQFNQNIDRVPLNTNSHFIINQKEVLLRYHYETKHNTKWFKLEQPNSLQEYFSQYKVQIPGSYYAILYDFKNNMIATTDTLHIDTAKVSTLLEDYELSRDTVVHVCENFSKSLRMAASHPDIKFDVYKNDTLITKTNSLIVNQYGKYHFKYKESEDEYWSSRVVEFKPKKSPLVATDKKLFIPNMSRLVFWFRNASDSDIYLTEDNFKIDLPFEIEFNVDFPIYLKTDSLLQCQIKYHNFTPEADTTHGNLYYYDDCGIERIFPVKGYNNYHKPHIFFTSEILLFDNIRNCISDTLLTSISLLNLEKATLKITSNDSSIVIPTFLNGTDSIVVADEKFVDIKLITLPNEFSDITLNKVITVDAYLEGELICTNMVPCKLEYNSNNYYAELPYETLIFCKEEDILHTYIDIANYTNNDLVFYLDNNDNVDFGYDSVIVERNKLSHLYVDLKYSETGFQNIRITEKLCQKEFILKIQTKLLELSVPNEKVIDIVKLSNQYIDFKIPIYSNDCSIYSQLEFNCPKYIKNIKNSIVNDTLVAEFSLKISDFKEGYDSMLVLNDYCERSYPVRLEFLSNHESIVKQESLNFISDPLTKSTQNLVLGSDSKDYSYKIDEITISNEAFSINEDLIFPIKLNGKANIAINYYNEFSNDTADLIIHYSEPYKFTEKVYLFGKSTAYQPKIKLSSVDSIFIKDLLTKDIMARIEIEDKVSQFLDSIKIIFNHNSSDLDIEIDKSKLSDYFVDSRIDKAENTTIITGYSAKTNFNILDFEYDLKTSEFIDKKTDRIELETVYYLNGRTSNIEKHTTVLNYEDLLETLLLNRLDNNWVYIKGSNPVEGSTDFELLTKLDEELKIYMINDLGKKYDLEVSRNQNIYYFNIDVNNFPLGAYTIVIEAQSKVFSKRIVLIK